MGCRKNAARLTAAERRAFTDAVNALRADGRYDDYVQQHQGAMEHGHGGPAFYPWHREFVRRFEEDLQSIDPDVSLPYWDWTVANVNASGTESLIWRDDLMGGPGQPGTGAVTTGPFAHWGLRRSAFDVFGFPGTGGTIAARMASPSYTTFRETEGPHGAAHVWVGGFVGNASIAPRDPVFWLIHCNVDRLWAEWIARHSGTPGFQPFLPLSGGASGHNLNDAMWPWSGGTSPFGVMPWQVSPEPVRPADLLDHRALDYRYDTVDPECRRVIKTRLKELKERLPKELAPKERLPKELQPKELQAKERLPKELAAKELRKEVVKELREPGQKQLAPKESSPKEIREVPLGDPFIRPELRPDLSGAALASEQDLAPELEALRDALLGRRDDLLGPG